MHGLELFLHAQMLAILLTWQKEFIVLKLSAFLGVLCWSLSSFADESFTGKRVLYVNSYHQGYPWSDGISDAIKQVLKPAGVELQIAYMDTKRRSTIAGEDFSERKEKENYEKRTHFQFDKTFFAQDFEEWKQQVLSIQNQVDVLIFDNAKNIMGWNDQEAQQFIKTNIKIPTGGTHKWLAPFIVLGIMKRPQEQGEWTAQTALKILQGQNPKDIPITANQHDELYLNQKLAQKLGITFSRELLNNATHIIQ